MILNITKPQYRRLVELLTLAQLEVEVFAEYEILENDEKDDYQTVLNSIFKHAPKMGCEDLLEFEDEELSWGAGRTHV